MGCRGKLFAPLKHTTMQETYKYITGKKTINSVPIWHDIHLSRYLFLCWNVQQIYSSEIWQISWCLGSASSGWKAFFQEINQCRMCWINWPCPRCCLIQLSLLLIHEFCYLQKGQPHCTTKFLLNLYSTYRTKDFVIIYSHVILNL